MKKFFTITNSNTEHTNDRSQRFDSFSDATKLAEGRIRSGRTDEVVILESIAIVRRSTPPIEIVEIN